MYAITIDMPLADLQSNAYSEIGAELKKFGFEATQGSVYLYQGGENGIAVVYKAVSRLSQIEWFKKSVRDIRVFKVEDWSDFTDIVKNA